MSVKEILKMGDPRLLRVAQPVHAFDTPELHALVADMQDTMRAANGAGLAAPQIGVDLQLVIFGTDAPNPRYPEAPVVPRTVLSTPYHAAGQRRRRGLGRLPLGAGLRAVVPRWHRIRYTGYDENGDRIDREAKASTPAWCSTNATTWSASSIRCGCATSAGSASPTCCFPAWTRRDDD